MLPRSFVWPLLAAILGFGLGGSVFWGLYGPNITWQQSLQASESHGTKPSNEHTPESVKPGEWLIGAATIALVAVTAALWWATRELVLDARENAERQQRAYVGADGIRRVPVTDESNPLHVLEWHLHVDWKNRGQTPALSVKSSFATQIFGKNGMPKEFDCDLTRSPEKPLEYITPTGTYRSPTVTLDVSDLADAVSKKKRIYVWGRIDYEDVFGGSHFLTFCDEVLANGNPGDAKCEIHFMGTRHYVST